MPRPPTAKTPFPLLAAALRRRAGELVESAQHLEEAGYRIGLPTLIVQRQVRALRDDAEALGEAYLIFTGLADVEGTIRAVLEISGAI